MICPNLWLIRSQTLANKQMVAPAKPKPGTGKNHANHRQINKNEFDPTKKQPKSNKHQEIQPNAGVMPGIKNRLAKICVPDLRCF